MIGTLTMDETIFQFYAENSNFFNIIFLFTIFIMILFTFIYWHLSYQSYLKTKDNTLDPHVIAELKPPSKIFFLFLISIFTASFCLFLQFYMTNNYENLNSLKYMIFKDDDVLFSNNKNISHIMDKTIPLKNIEMAYVNDFKYAKFKNLERKYCQISIKFKGNNKNESPYKDINNSLSLTIPENNLFKNQPCIEIAKQMVHLINYQKKSFNLEAIGLNKTEEQKEIDYSENKERSLYIQHLFKFITKPGSFFDVK